MMWHMYAHSLLLQSVTNAILKQVKKQTKLTVTTIQPKWCAIVDLSKDTSQKEELVFKKIQRLKVNKRSLIDSETKRQ